MAFHLKNLVPHGTAWKFVKVFVPRRLRLPTRCFLAAVLRTLEPELVYFDKICPQAHGNAIDIGAHRGCWTFALAQRFEKVYAFEPNPALLDDLLDYRSDKIEVFNVALSNVEGDGVLHLPFDKKGKQLTYWSTLCTRQLPFVDRWLDLPIKTARLDSFAIENVSFIKIDVEGHEIDVLNGAAETIKRCLPTMVIELNEPTIDHVTNLCASWGYRRMRLEDLAGVPGFRVNYIFLHENAGR
jgi:FkbM family methyltransferase